MNKQKHPNTKIYPSKGWKDDTDGSSVRVRDKIGMEINIICRL